MQFNTAYLHQPKTTDCGGESNMYINCNCSAQMAPYAHNSALSRRASIQYNHATKCYAERSPSCALIFIIIFYECVSVMFCMRFVSTLSISISLCLNVWIWINHNAHVCMRTRMKWLWVFCVVFFLCVVPQLS